MYSELINLSNKELKIKIKFGENTGGPYGVKLVNMCTDILNNRNRG